MSTPYCMECGRSGEGLDLERINDRPTCAVCRAGTDVDLRTATSGTGRVVIPSLQTKDDAVAIVKQLRSIVRLVQAQAKHLPDEIIHLDGNNPEDAAKLAELAAQGGEIER